MDIIYRYDPFQPIDTQTCKTPKQAAKALQDGNRRFESMVKKVRSEVFGGDAHRPVVIPSNPLSLGFPMAEGKAPVQRPFAIVLGCSDARAPVELIFDQPSNEVFVVRVAGNVLGTECLGSIQYAVRNFPKSVKLVVVLGHSGCGAVGATVDLYLDPFAYGAIAQTHALRSIVDRISVVVRIADRALASRLGPGISDEPGYKAALWEMAIYMNAALTAYDVARELEPVDSSTLQVVYGVYDLTSQKVEAAPRQPATFAPAPKHADDFSALAEILVASILEAGTLARP